MKNIFMVVTLLNIACLSMTCDKQVKHEKILRKSFSVKTDNQIIASCESDVAKVIRDARKKSKLVEQEEYFCEKITKLMLVYDPKVIEKVLADELLKTQKEQALFKD